MKILKLSGYDVLLDDDDYDNVSSMSWSVILKDVPRGLFYFRHSLPRDSSKHRKYLLLHRFIMEAGPGDPIIDHINGNTLDCRKSNLRMCTNVESQINRGKPSNNHSGYKGVYYYKPRHCWRSVIVVNKKRLYLGNYKNLDDAHWAYELAARKYFGSFKRESISE